MGPKTPPGSVRGVAAAPPSPPPPVPSGEGGTLVKPTTRWDVEHAPGGGEGGPERIRRGRRRGPVGGGEVVRGV